MRETVLDLWSTSLHTQVLQTPFPELLHISVEESDGNVFLVHPQEYSEVSVSLYQKHLPLKKLELRLSLDVQTDQTEEKKEEEGRGE